MSHETKRKLNKKMKRCHRKTYKKKLKHSDQSYSRLRLAFISIPVNPGLKYGNMHVISRNIYNLVSKYQKCHVVCVKYNDPKVFDILDTCHGCILPPETELNLKACDQSNSLDFFNSCFSIYTYCKNRNKTHFFPCLCICRSFQNIILYEKYKKKVNHQKYIDPCGDKSTAFHKVNMVNKSYLIEFFEKPLKTCMFNKLTKTQLKLLKSKHGVPHFNNFGFHYDDVKNKLWFNKSFKPITYSFDHLHNKIINSIEHKKYPIFGIQFHPEHSKQTHFIYNFFETLLQKSKPKISKVEHETKYKLQKIDNYLILI